MNDTLIQKILSEIGSNKDYRLITDDDDFENYRDFQEYRACISWLINEKILIQPLERTDIISLTLLGKEIVNQGGWLEFKSKKADKEKIEKARQERKDKSDELDLQIKKWQVKTKFFPYIVSTLALAVSIFSYFKPDKKQQDLQPMQQQIQQLKDHVKSLDSLHQVDSLQKRHK